MTESPGRCASCGTDPLYIAYHDAEWGAPVYDARALWEKLTLDGFQAGLAWITILRKRDSLRSAFDGFDPEKVGRYNEADINRLLADPGVIRSRAKIQAAIRGARIWLDMRDSGEDFSAWIWSFVDGKPVQDSQPGLAQSDASLALSNALKRRGFSFCGPVITYAFMQAAGLVNDYAATCFRRDEVRAMGAI